MKKLQLFLSLSFITLFVNGQQNKLSLGVSGSLDYYTFNSNLDRFGLEDKMTTCYSYGLNMQYNFNERIFLQSSLLYSKKGSKSIINTWIAIDDYTQDPSIPDSPFGTEEKISCLNIPLMLGYYLKKEGVMRFSLATGMNNEIRLKHQQIISSRGKEETITLSSPWSPRFLSSAQLNLGIECHLGKKIFFSITPYFKYGFNTIDMFTSSISYGGIFSINYKFVTQKEQD